MENILLDLNTRYRAHPTGRRRGYWLAGRRRDHLADTSGQYRDRSNVRGEFPETVEYRGAAEPLTKVWIAVRANLRAVLETVTLADLVEGSLPDPIGELTQDPEAWIHH